jgi:AcrR family transcriptional regulator
MQRHALRLFREQGYAETTVDQIAEAAEVSPSTFFRYFPTKEDVVLYDALDPIQFQVFQAQPRELGTIEALRATVLRGTEELAADHVDQERERAELMRSVPELRGRVFEQLGSTLRMLAEQIAQREGTSPDDFAVRTLAGMVVGVSMAAMSMVDDDPSRDHFELIAAGLAQLQERVPHS